MKKTLAIIGTILGVGIIIFLCSISIIKTGEIGIVSRFGAVQDRVLTAGVNFHIPFVESVKKINCKTQKLDNENESASKDLQTVNTKVSINYSVNSTKAPDLFRVVGTDYEAVIITPILTDTIKSVIAEYTAEELITKRNNVSTRIYEKLNTRLEEQGITVSNVNITDLQFSEAYNKAIEAKQVAQQEALKSKEELEKTKVEAEKKVVEAQATADANKIINESLTADNLEKQKLENQANAISKWNGVLPSTMASDTVPFLNVN